jgi:hypothetical protein
VTHALVGAWTSSDTNEYCTHTSFDILYGDLDQGLSIKPDTDASPPPCVDGGLEAPAENDGGVDPNTPNTAG